VFARYPSNGLQISAVRITAHGAPVVQIDFGQGATDDPEKSFNLVNDCFEGLVNGIGFELLHFAVRCATE
jgi:hypothetical protein